MYKYYINIVFLKVGGYNCPSDVEQFLLNLHELLKD